MPLQNPKGKFEQLITDGFCLAENVLDPDMLSRLQQMDGTSWNLVTLIEFFNNFIYVHTLIQRSSHFNFTLNCQVQTRTQ